MSQYVAIPAQSAALVEALLAEEEREAQRGHDFVLRKATEDPSDLLVVDQVRVCALRLARARIALSAIRDALPAAPIPF